MEYLIQHTDKGWQVVRSGNGLPPYEKRGPVWPDPKKAREHYDREIGREAISPLRDEADSKDTSASSQSGSPPL